MTHDELQRLYEMLDDTIAHLESNQRVTAAAIATLKEVREKLASGGGPGPK